VTTVVKLCECGCGHPTQPAARTDARRGLVKDTPARFLRGHKPGPYGPQPANPNGPRCQRDTLSACRARDCRRPMHRNKFSARCRKGHVAHGGRGVCQNCVARMRRGSQVELGPIEQPRMRPDEVLDEWVWLRGTVRWIDFPTKVGLTLKGWQRLFAEAEKRGDPRAVKHPNDEPVRHWRVDDSTPKRKEAG
jgi:hypothetical protein